MWSDAGTLYNPFEDGTLGIEKAEVESFRKTIQDLVAAEIAVPFYIEQSDSQRRQVTETRLPGENTTTYEHRAIPNKQKLTGIGLFTKNPNELIIIGYDDLVISVHTANSLGEIELLKKMRQPGYKGDVRNPRKYYSVMLPNCTTSADDPEYISKKLIEAREYSQELRDRRAKNRQAGAKSFINTFGN